MKKLYLAMTLALATMVVAAGAVFAAVEFDSVNGTGFVGKGDVQLVYSWNNKQLQDNANRVQFRASTTSETTWTCSKPHPSDPTKPDTIDRRSTTTTTQGVLSSIARDTSKGKDGGITGFNLKGYSGTPSEETTGDAVGTCGGGASGFTYDNNAQTTPGSSVLQVSTDGSNWFTLS